MKRLVVLLLLIGSFTYAQEFKNYDWQPKPKIHKLTDTEKDNSSIGILKRHIVEYYIPADSEEPKIYETEHTITRVIDDKGIAQNNTVYVPMYGVNEVIDIKARAISSTGKITLLNKENIKEVKNVEEYGDFKIFALEGVEKNSEIEVLYIVEKDYDLYGSEVLQSGQPIKLAEFLFITGELNSNVKAYRTDAKFEDVVLEGRKAKKLVIENIPAMMEEEYATPKANNIEVVYQCFPKGQNITQDMFWTNVSNNIGRKVFQTETSPVLEADIAKITDGQTDLSDFQKANRIDNFVKTNFSVIKNNNEELSNLNYVLQNRTASDFGILKVYASYLSALEVPYEIVITANRFQLKFDPDFFVPGMLRDFMIYLPTEKKYISPDRLEYRVGEAPFNILGNKGLFIRNDYSHYFQKIDQVDPDYSRTERNMQISFPDEFDHVNIKQQQRYTGHWSATNRGVLTFTSEQGKEDFKDYLTGSGIEDKEIVNYTVKNEDLNQEEYNVPFEVVSEINSGSLLEEAGDSYIFQVGKVIGTQSELYQENERVNPIEMTYPNQYDYTITVQIPEGYTVEGLNSLKLDKNYKIDGKKIAKFESNYELKGNELIIKIQEFYKTNEFDLNRYEEFRTVINAASDFNKAAILIKATE